MVTNPIAIKGEPAHIALDKALVGRIVIIHREDDVDQRRLWQRKGISQTDGVDAMWCDQSLRPMQCLTTHLDNAGRL